LQIAKAFGASDIIAVDVQDEKLQKAKALGATHTINATQEDAIERIRVCILSFFFNLLVRHKSSSFKCIFLNYDLNFFKMEALL
jgi:Zn-dependent alcohol dehydrogenase